MFRFTRTVLNNLNKDKYLKNINDVRVRELTVDNTGNNPITKEGDLSNIKYYEEELRHNNLKVFYKYYLIARAKRFFIVTMPAIIGALSIGSFCLPTYHETNKDIRMYNVKTTTLSNTLGEAHSEEKYYDTVLDKKLIDFPDMENLSSRSSELNFRISDGTNSIVSNLLVESDGSLRVNTANQVDVLDLTGYEDLEYSDMNAKYADLFDDIISILSDSGALSSNEKEELTRLSQLDKAEIIVQIVEKEYIGKENVRVNASIIGWRVFLLIVLGLYIFFECLCLSDDGYVDNKSVEVGRNGELRKDPSCSSEFGLMYGPMKYRELFMKAEKDRISAIESEAYKNIEEADIDKIFTSFEKKLLKKF